MANPVLNAPGGPITKVAVPMRARIPRWSIGMKTDGRNWPPASCRTRRAEWARVRTAQSVLEFRIVSVPARTLVRADPHLVGLAVLLRRDDLLLDALVVDRAHVRIQELTEPCAPS